MGRDGVKALVRNAGWQVWDSIAIATVLPTMREKSYAETMQDCEGTWDEIEIWALCNKRVPISQIAPEIPGSAQRAW